MLITSLYSGQVLGVRRIHFHSLFVRFFFLVLTSKDNLHGARFTNSYTHYCSKNLLHKLHGHHSANNTNIFA